MGWNDESVMAPTVGRTMVRNVRGREGDVCILAISVVEVESREVGAPTVDSKARCNQGLSSVGGWDRKTLVAQGKERLSNSVCRAPKRCVCLLWA